MGIARITAAYLGSYPYPPNFLFKNVHEYILTFAKPSATRTKGPKVRQYSDLNGFIIYSSLVDEWHQGLKKSSKSSIEGIATLVL